MFLMHVPLHTTENYNSQLNNQKRIYVFWLVDSMNFFLMIMII